MDITRGVLLMSSEPHRQAPPGEADGAMPYIKRVIHESGVKQHVIADALGMRPGQFSGMLKNTSPGYLPRPDQLAIICRILRITQAEVIRAAGYLSDSPAARRLDDDGDEWVAEQNAIAATLGAAQVQRIAERVTREIIEELYPGADDQRSGRQMSLGGI